VCSDLASQDMRPDDVEPEEEVPNVVRKQGDRYPARDRRNETDSQVSPSGDGTEGEQRPQSHAQRRPSDEDVIPQLPEDLFDWPEAPGDSRSRERHRAESAEERDESEEPPRP
jgi:hypothetical protein